MIKGILVIGIWLVMASNATAEWRIEQFTDRMTDKVFKFANVAAKESSVGVSAKLEIECVVNSIVGGLYVSVQLSEKMPEGAWISYRIDEQPVQHQDMPMVRSTARSAIHGLNPEAIRRAKRFRLQWNTSTGIVLFYEFDVSGADKAIAQIPCAKTRIN